MLTMTNSPVGSRPPGNSVPATVAPSRTTGLHAQKAMTVWLCETAAPERGRGSWPRESQAQPGRWRDRAPRHPGPAQNWPRRVRVAFLGSPYQLPPLGVPSVA